MKILCGIVVCSLVFIAAARPDSRLEMAQSAQAFVASVGVNVHLTYTDTPYGDFPSVERALTGLGVRHIRDGLLAGPPDNYYEHLNELGRLGIKGIFVTNPKESDSTMTAFPARVRDSFEGYEAPNEFDARRDPDWSATLAVFMKRLHDAAKTDPATSAFPIIGPSLTRPASFPSAAACSPFFDDANLHNYFGGRNPGTHGWGSGGYGSIDWNLNLAEEAWPGKPTVTTETGYQTDVNKPQGIPEDVAGVYLPRALLEQWMHGIRRTYIYQLLDLGNESKFSDNSYGLLHSDFSPKPAYAAIQGMLRLLSDPGPAFRLGGIEYSLTGDLSGVEHVLFEKRDGSFFLTLWIEEPAYDVDGKKRLAVPPQRASIRTDYPMNLTVHALDDAGSMHDSRQGVSQASALELTDKVTILELRPARP
jgi:hypothetical protein